MGQRAERRVLQDGGGHGEAAAAAYGLALSWFDRILDGRDVPDTCP